MQHRQNKTSREPLMQEAAASHRQLLAGLGFRLPDHDKQDADGGDCRDVTKMGHG